MLSSGIQPIYLSDFSSSAKQAPLKLIFDIV